MFFFLLTVTAEIYDIPCSHIRALLIYNEALASNCTIWGMVPNGTDLLERYDM